MISYSQPIHMLDTEYFTGYLNNAQKHAAHNNDGKLSANLITKASNLTNDIETLDGLSGRRDYLKEIVQKTKSAAFAKGIFVGLLAGILGAVTFFATGGNLFLAGIVTIGTFSAGMTMVSNGIDHETENELDQLNQRCYTLQQKIRNGLSQFENQTPYIADPSL